MKRIILFPVIALLTELATSWWKWIRAPTDTLRTYYRGNFWAYAVERLPAWIIIFVLLYVTLLVAERIFSKRSTSA